MVSNLWHFFVWEVLVGRTRTCLEIQSSSRTSYAPTPNQINIVKVVPVSSTSKISCHQTMDLSFESRLHQKPTGVLV